MKPAPLYAWVTLTDEGKPSIVGTYLPELQAHLPLVAFSREHMERFRDIAEHHGRATGQPVNFVEFSTMKILTPTN